MCGPAHLTEVFQAPFSLGPVTYTSKIILRLQKCLNHLMIVVGLEVNVADAVANRKFHDGKREIVWHLDLESPRIAPVLKLRLGACPMKSW